jgi:D-xylose transport system permease protein
MSVEPLRSDALRPDLGTTDAVSAGAVSDFGLDHEPKTFATIVRDFRSRVGTGDLGSLPAILAILVLVAVFGAARPNSFLTALNLANFLDQAAAVIVIAMAVSFVLLLGEIDLAAGYTAGVAGAVLALRLRDGWGLPAAIVLAALVATALGVWTGFLVAKLGIPSFVVTLANFLVFQGILLILVKEGGSVRIDNDVVKGIVGDSLSPALSWIVGILGVAAFAFAQIHRRRRSDGVVPMSIVVVRIALAAVFVVALVLILNRNRAFASAAGEIRGMPYVIPLVLVIMLVLTFLLNRTRYGRHLMAVGGNQEAARRAGINVVRVRLSAFAATGLLAGIGGAFLASRVNSIDPNTGGNDTLLLAVGAAVIGGTSLFGGQGRMLNAVLGGLVLALIPNGLGLVGKASPFGKEIDFGSSGVKFICAGLALLLAASVDALGRKRTA